MRHTIEGSTFQSLHIDLEPGEVIYSETGALLHMSTNVELSTNFQGKVRGMFKRAITGNSIALNYFKTAGGPGEVTFATRMPGHIIPVEVGEKEIVVQRYSFLCAPESVDLSIQTSFNLFGIFGGNGLVFNRLKGQGTAFLSIDGEVIQKELGYGDSFLVHPAHLAAYESTVKTELRKMKGFKNMFFGGDGFALVQVSGPGKVWLHSLSIQHLAELMAEFGGGREEGGAAGAIGAFIGGIVKDSL